MESCPAILVADVFRKGESVSQDRRSGCHQIQDYIMSYDVPDGVSMCTVRPFVWPSVSRAAALVVVDGLGSMKVPYTGRIQGGAWVGIGRRDCA